MAEVEPGGGAQAPRPAAPDAPGLGELLAGVLAQFREVSASLVRLADLRVEQARLATRRVVILVVLAVWSTVVLLAATVLGVSYAISGLAGFLTERLGGRIWIGDLATGGIVLALILAAGFIVRMAMQRANLRRLRRKYEARTDQPRDRPQPAVEASR